jgi:transcriptional regulator with XRE-family HTH domain
MARFQTRLDHLFRTVRAPDGSEYSYRHVALRIEQLVGYKTSSSSLQELRAGVRSNPSMKHLHGLCAFFGVPIAYFFDEDLTARVDTQLELAASLRDASVRELARQAVGLSAPTLQAITQIVEHARGIEGLAGVGKRARSSRQVPRRRGRRAHTPGKKSPHAAPVVPPEDRAF